MSLQNRLARLETVFATIDGCPRCSGPLVKEILGFSPDLGELPPQIPSCPRCGKPRGDVLLIEEQIVAPLEQIPGTAE